MCADKGGKGWWRDCCTVLFLLEQEFFLCAVVVVFLQLEDYYICSFFFVVVVVLFTQKCSQFVPFYCSCFRHPPPLSAETFEKVGQWESHRSHQNFKGTLFAIFKYKASYKRGLASVLTPVKSLFLQREGGKENNTNNCFNFLFRISNCLCSFLSFLFLGGLRFHLVCFFR